MAVIKEDAVGKRFRKDRCAYCTSAWADSADHIFARKFFLIENRGHLPQVPACRQCNSRKSLLELYACTVLSFGGRHPAAVATFETMTVDRLKKNHALWRELCRGAASAWIEESGGIAIPTGSIPVDGSRLAGLFESIARGLSWFHWKTYVQPDDIVISRFLTDRGVKEFRPPFLHSSEKQVEKDLGNETFHYEGFQIEEPSLHIWFIRAFGGVWLGDTQALPHVATTIAVLVQRHPAKCPAGERKTAASIDAHPEKRIESGNSPNVSRSIRLSPNTVGSVGE